MIPKLAAWLGVEPMYVPGYAVMVGVASILAASIILSQARREGVGLRDEARTLMLAYVGALAGGYLYEWIRVTPEALVRWTVEPYLHVGRAAYGGLIFALGAAFLHQRRIGAPPLRFFDRAALAMGPIYAFVRAGCFLEGCDYGAVTASALGVRYPSGSLAASAHAQAGGGALGAGSLPGHPTQLNEGDRKSGV